MLNKTTTHFEIGILEMSEIPALLALQAANNRHVLDAQTIQNQGFISFRYTPEQILLKMETAPQIIARADGQLIGYALSTTQAAATRIPDFHPLQALVKQFSENGQALFQKKIYFMGQICVQATWRGCGVFDALYAAHKAHFSDQYDCLVTEIASENKRSLAAHARVGFSTFHTFTDDTNHVEWQVVKWDF
jgi:predicted GNAT superfamily acetyltransferase